MRINLPTIFAATTLFISANIKAQNDQFAYAVTDVAKEGASWSVLRKIDLKTGQYSDVLLNGLDAKVALFDVATKKQILQNNNGAHLPFNTGVAAIALEKNSNRLFFTPMYYHQLRYIDLTSMKVYNFTDQHINSDIEKKDAGKTFSRMAITPDGIGYAISNDAEDFIRFTTGKTPSIKQLGRLIDAPSNKNISVHNSCTSYGGDIISDDKGTLYLITGVNNIFTIDPKTKVATHLGSIKGLPANFTTSAAVVHTNGEILISSSLGSFPSFLVHPKTWQATVYNEGAIAYHTSDLANSNYLFAKPKSALIEANKSVAFNSNKIQVYPNPVIDNSSFTVQFSNINNGTYYLQLIDLTGRPVYSRRVTITAKNNTQTVPVSTINANGIYLVRVVNSAKKSVFEQKLMIQ